jgi:hypothetical protein
VFLLISLVALSQGKELPFGKVVYADLEMKSYPKDTSANAVVLNEIGSAYISHGEHEGLIFQRYLKIKIIRRQGFDQANFWIPLYRQDNRKEKLLSVVASTYNLVNGSMKELKMDMNSVFTENLNKYADLVKFTLPDIREGSVLEVKYVLNSPFYFNFRPWEFQSDIPKVHSEYLALIPANYIYNISLRGYLSIKENVSTVVKDCFSPGGGRMADCSSMKFAMDDIPSFSDEEYMTAKVNFLSQINFELSEVKRFDGRVDKITKEWKDVDQELRQHDDFGAQIRKARNVLGDTVKSLVRGKSDTLDKAKAIYDFIKKACVWNGNFGKYTELGVRKALDAGKGNAADVNLSLVGALQSAGISSFPVILSTRDNGLAVELYPVMSEFNYVIASVHIGGTHYLLDATDRYHPFGLLPLRCINGKGRLMTKESSWVELKGRDKQKTVFRADLIQTGEGYEGTFSVNYQGYDALKKRTEIFSAGEREYDRLLRNSWKEIEILKHHVKNLDSLENTLEETMTVKITDSQPGAGTVYFDPFISERWESNPFKSKERFYPVDFGVPREQVLTLTLHYLPSYEVDELPASAALSLPEKGGRYLFNVANVGNVVSITSSLTLNKSVYNSTEYHYLKELFARVVQIQQSQIVFKKKSKE